jgi:pyrrolidone-carboxylate peptidase
MKILVQGFGPFGRFQENPSEVLVRALANQAPAGCDLHAEVPSMSLDLQQASLRLAVDVCAASPGAYQP